MLAALVDVDEPIGVQAIARRVGIPPSSTHRLLQSLTESGYAERTNGHYSPGIELYRLATRMQQKDPLLKVGVPVIQRINAACGETVALGRFFAGTLSLTFVATVESSHPVRHVVAVGVQEKLHAGAHAKAILAYLPREVQEEYLRTTGLQKVTEHTMTDPAALLADLEETRRRGYAHSRSERIPGAVGFAAPVWGPGRVVCGVLGITVPETRYGAEQADSLQRLAREGAEEISRALGGL